MKNLRILFVLLLALLGASNVAAQEIADGEAFYIYRNDGDFDGFFYDQVEEMRYSKLGVDSVEYDEYVTYEVVTADSLYRIPLEVIDSISFVQPEIEFNPDVRHMDLLGMSEYITEVNGMTLTFDASLPFALRPKEGNVLLGFTGVLEENGFGGRVQSVTSAGDKIIVSCAQLEKFSDIFKRFISVEEVGADENGKPLTRRLAGYKSMVKSARRVSDGLTTNLVDVSMNTHLKLLPDGFLYHANVDLSLALKIRLAMVYRVEADDAFFKVMLMESFSLQAGIDLGVDGSDFKKIACVPTFGIKFPVGLYLFEIRPVPEFGVRYGGDISFKAKFPSFTRAFRQTWVMDSSNSDGMRYEGNGMDAGPAQSVSEFFSDASGEIMFNGFVQVGIKTSCAVYTNSWVEKIFNAGVGVDFFLGPKIEGSIIGISANVSDAFDGAYPFRNNKLSGTWLALDYEAFGEDQILNNPKRRYTFSDGSFSLLPRWEMAMLPTVDMKKAEYKDGKVKAEMETNECTVFGKSDLGFAIMDKDEKNILARDYLQHFKFGSKVPFFLNTSFLVKDYKPGIYQVVPLMTEAFCGEFPIKSQAKEVKIPIWLEVPPVVQAPATEGFITIPAETNGELNNTNVIYLPLNKKLGNVVSYATVTASYPECDPVSKVVEINQAGGSAYYNILEFSGSTNNDLAVFSNRINGEWTDNFPCSLSSNGTSATITGSWSWSDTLTDGTGIYSPGTSTENCSGFFTINLTKDEEKSTSLGYEVYEVTGGNIHAHRDANNGSAHHSETSDLSISGGSLRLNDGYLIVTGNCEHDESGTNFYPQHYSHDSSVNFYLRNK